VTAADLDGDGTTDIALANYTGEMTTLANATNMIRIQQQPQSFLLLPGMGGSLSVLASDSATTNLTYQWRRNGLPLSDANGFGGTRTANLSVTNAATAPHDGVYDVVVSNGCGSVKSQMTYIAVPACPADLDRSGVTNTDDLFLCLDQYFRGCP
jgi:hypothetical protein